MRQTTRKTLLAALFEACFVVLGVMLALIGNEWRQAAVDRDHAATAKASIIEELKANRALASASLDYHEGLLKMLAESRQSGQKPALSAFPKGFIRPARLNSTAWSSASQTGAMAHLPYADILSLSAAYSLQDRYEHQTRSVGQLFYGQIMQSGTQSIADNYGNLFSIVAIFVYQEKELMAAYDELMASESQPQP